MGFALSNMQLSSTAFTNSSAIPAKYTGESDDVSPELTWKNAPEGTKAFAIVCHDPDAPLVSKNGTYGFVHWVLYNIPGNVTHLSEAADDYTSGKNDFGNAAYGGPMPPNGHGTHHYFFWVLALKSDETLDAGLSLWQLLAKIEPSIIGMNRLIGTYSRD